MQSYSRQLIHTAHLSFRTSCVSNARWGERPREAAPAFPPYFPFVSRRACQKLGSKGFMKSSPEQSPPARPTPTALTPLGRLPMKQRICGGLVFLIVGLFFLAESYLQPLHWAKMHPGETVTIYPQFLMLGSSCELMALSTAIGLRFNRALTLAILFLGVVVGFLLRAMLISTLTALALLALMKTDNVSRTYEQSLRPLAHQLARFSFRSRTNRARSNCGHQLCRDRFANRPVRHTLHRTRPARFQRYARRLSIALRWRQPEGLGQRPGNSLARRRRRHRRRIHPPKSQRLDSYHQPTAT